jgi:hypothetical protein
MDVKKYKLHVRAKTHHSSPLRFTNTLIHSTRLRPMLSAVRRISGSHQSPLRQNSLESEELMRSTILFKR